MPNAIVQGGTLKCSCGSAPWKLIVTSQQDLFIGDKLAPTILDQGPGTNIPLFGTCSVLTAEAAGVPTLCAPAIPGAVRSGCDGARSGNAFLKQNTLFAGGNPYKRTSEGIASGGGRRSRDPGGRSSGEDRGKARLPDVSTAG